MFRVVAPFFSALHDPRAFDLEPDAYSDRYHMPLFVWPHNPIHTSAHCFRQYH